MDFKKIADQLNQACADMNGYADEIDKLVESTVLSTEELQSELDKLKYEAGFDAE